jgi:hypothetical protein
MIGNNSREGADLTAQDQATTEISTSLFVNLARIAIIRMKPPRDGDDFTLAEMQAHRDRW